RRIGGCSSRNLYRASCVMSTGISVENLNRASCTLPGMSRIGLRIKAVRAEKGLSLEAVATRVGVRYQTIQDLENGASQGSKHLLKIAGALGVRPHWLETGLGPRDEEGSNVRDIVGQKLGKQASLQIDDD